MEQPLETSVTARAAAPAPPPVSSPNTSADASTASGLRQSLAAGEGIQLVLAGSLWLIAAVVLGFRGAGWLVTAPWGLALALLGVALGLAKARFLLDRIARGVARRIHDRGPGASIVGFLSVRSWVVVVVMMAGGHALRLTAAPRPALGVLYVAIATALAVASRTYWVVLGRGWATLR